MNKKEKGTFINVLFMNHINYDPKTAYNKNLDLLLLMLSLKLINDNTFKAAKELLKDGSYYNFNKLMELLANKFKIEIINDY